MANISIHFKVIEHIRVFEFICGNVHVMPHTTISFPINHCLFFTSFGWPPIKIDIALLQMPIASPQFSEHCSQFNWFAWVCSSKAVEWKWHRVIAANRKAISLSLIHRKESTDCCRQRWWIASANRTEQTACVGLWASDRRWDRKLRVSLRYEYSFEVVIFQNLNK